MIQKTIVTDYDFLEEIIRVRSYNADGKRECARKLYNKLRQLGFGVQVYQGYGAPIIYAEYTSDAKKNVLFYMHYDVKPPGDINAWKSNPFELYYDTKEERLYARGTGDDKGQIFATLMGIKKAISSGKRLNYNICVLIEGDEESGSNGLSNFISDRLSNKEYDMVIVNDSHWLDDSPVIYCGCRGQLDIRLSYCDEDMKGNYHAGNFGGLYSGAARHLLHVVDCLLGEVDRIIGIGRTTKSNYANAVSLTYFSSGDAQRSLLPNEAVAKMDVRYIDNGIIKKIEEMINAYCISFKINYEISQNEEGFYNVPDLKQITMLKNVIQDVTKLNVSERDYCGAYLPLNKMKDIRGTKYVIPFAQTDECNHVPNENIKVKNIIYGIEIVNNILINSELTQ